MEELQVEKKKDSVERSVDSGLLNKRVPLSKFRIRNLANQNSGRNWFLRILTFAFIIIVIISVLLYGSEFSSPISLRSSMLQTRVDPYIVKSDNGTLIVKTHIQTTGFVKPKTIIKNGTV